MFAYSVMVSVLVSGMEVSELEFQFHDNVQF